MSATLDHPEKPKAPPLPGEAAPVAVAKLPIGRLFDDEVPSPKLSRKFKLEKAYPWLLLAIDVLNLSLFFAISVAVRYSGSFAEAWSIPVYSVLLITCCTGLYMIGGYHHRTNKKCLRYSTEHILVSIGVAIVAFLVIYTFVAYGKNLHAARANVTSVLIGFSVSSLVYRRFLDPRFRQAFTTRNIDIIGNGLLAEQLKKRILVVVPLKAVLGMAYVEATEMQLPK